MAQALALLAQGLRRAGGANGRIAVEDPGSRGSRDELAYWGLRPVPIPVDSRGLMVDQLTGTGVRGVLLTPAHQFPTGVVLAPGRRRDLLDWAAATKALIIEDDYDAEYRYDRAPVPALQASAPAQVAYAGSTSKTLAPGMRLGWLIPPPRLRADLVQAKHASDLGSPALPQLVLAHLIASGELERHIRGVRKRQRSRRDALLRALREHLPEARVQGCSCIRFPGTVSGQGRRGSCSATPRTHPISCERPSGASRSSSRQPGRGPSAPPSPPPPPWPAGSRRGDGAGPPSAAG